MTSPQVQTIYGQLEGLDHHSHQSYLGIPFAKAPIGELRFRAPRQPDRWLGNRDAKAFGASCPQGHHRVPGMAASGLRDEDCLYLNVFTPRADGGRRAVLFWIHGGGFTMGSGSEQLYNGGYLAEQGDVVVVTIHYRLGAFGYSYFGDDGARWGASPNVGQLDQIAALEWVNANIASFGGDPDNVTIFGESAGASAVAALLAMPAAEGLFHKAIMQSGAGIRSRDTAPATDATNALLKELQIDDHDPGALAARSADEIVAAQLAVSARLEQSAFRPVFDDNTLPKLPHEAVGQGYAADIPVIIGTNRDESKLFNVVPDRPELSDDDLIAGVGRLTGESGERAAAIVSTFRASRSRHRLPTANIDILDGVQSVVAFRLPAIQLAAAQSLHQRRTFHYLFTWESPARHGALGACHALELPFVFRTLDAPTQDRFAGRGPDAERLADAVATAWTTFAKTGDPSHRGIGTWKPFTLPDRQTMLFDRECRMELDPFADERKILEEA